MAITDVDVFAHLTDADIENLAVELDAIRQDIEDSRGERDARYIRRTIAAQRALEVAGRLLLAASSRRSAWWAGTATLGVAKIIENMEIGHNVMHGQWDWMNDPEIHSSTWEWDMSGSSKHWRYTHNFVHHKYTNILGMDDDVGYGMLRVTRDQRWKRFNLFNLVYNTLLALGLRVGRRPAARRDRQDRQEADGQRRGPAADRRVLGQGRPAGGQGLRRVPGADLAVARRDVQVDAEGQRDGQRDPQRLGQRGDLLRPFPRRRREIHQDRHDRRDQGPVVPAPDAGQRQLRRRPGAAVHERQPVPPDRAPPVSRICRATGCTRSRCGCAQVCDKYDLPYTTGSFLVQYGKTWRTIAKLSLPNKYLRDDRRQRAGDPQRADVRRTGARFRRHRPGDRPPPRAEDRDRHGAGLAARQACDRGPPRRTTWPPNCPAARRTCSHCEYFADFLHWMHARSVGDASCSGRSPRRLPRRHRVRPRPRRSLAARCRGPPGRRG